MGIRFQEISVPHQLKASHEASGGKELFMHTARVADGFLLVQVGLEPAGEGGAAIYHISATCAAYAALSAKTIRAPGNDEMESLLTLCPGIEFDEDNRNGSKHWRHLWQVEGEKGGD